MLVWQIFKKQWLHLRCNSCGCQTRIRFERVKVQNPKNPPAAVLAFDDPNKNFQFRVSDNKELDMTRDVSPEPEKDPFFCDLEDCLKEDCLKHASSGLPQGVLDLPPLVEEYLPVISKGVLHFLNAQFGPVLEKLALEQADTVRQYVHPDELASLQRLVSILQGQIR